MEQQNDSLRIGRRSYILSLSIIFVLMAFTYILTLCIPGGEYARIADENGHMIIDTAA